jgi:hypothetical protein
VLNQLRMAGCDGRPTPPTTGRLLATQELRSRTKHSNQAVSVVVVPPEARAELGAATSHPSHSAAAIDAFFQYLTVRYKRHADILTTLAHQAGALTRTRLRLMWLCAVKSL